MQKGILSILLFLLSTYYLRAQCTTRGQTPATAFPVCGTSTFTQNAVPACVNGIIPVDCPANGNVYQDVNPFWFKFTCFQSGSLVLMIQPKDPGDDYDWQLFDITGHPITDVYNLNPTVASEIFVACNWSGVPGNTGTSLSPLYTSLIQCGSYNVPIGTIATSPPPFSMAPELIQGHNYLLMISHFSGSTQSGYSLSFGGGTASITDTVPPMLKSATVSCNPRSIVVKLNKPMQCSSLASDGSDFSISSALSSVISASGFNCSTGFDLDSVVLTLNNPLPVGSFSLIAQNGTDGNTLLDDCDNSIPVGNTIPFSVPPVDVSAAFNYQVFLGCEADTIEFNQNGANGINFWHWYINDSLFSTLEDPTIIYSVFGQKNTELIVSNGICSDTVSSVVSLDNTLLASFNAPSFVCPADKASLIDSSIGNIIAWNWDYGDGTTAMGQNPSPHQFPMDNGDKTYTVSLIIQNSAGCRDTAVRLVEKLGNCIIAVPNAFTPNGDGLNDYLYPLNAYLADNLEFRVYNRYGQLVFETRDWTKKWDGTIGGLPQPTGTYVWMLQYTDHDSGKRFFLKGTSVLIR